MQTNQIHYYHFIMFLYTDLQYSEELASGICNSPDSVQACYKLLNALCMGVKENIETLSELLMDIFYNGEGEREKEKEKGRERERKREREKRERGNVLVYFLSLLSSL